MTKTEFYTQFRSAPLDKQWEFLLSIPQEDRHKVVFDLDNDVSYVYWGEEAADETGAIEAQTLCECLYHDEGVILLLRALGFTADRV